MQTAGVWDVTNNLNIGAESEVCEEVEDGRANAVCDSCLEPERPLNLRPVS